jgi:hypothetical protein
MGGGACMVRAAGFPDYARVAGRHGQNNGMRCGLIYFFAASVEAQDYDERE